MKGLVWVPQLSTNNEAIDNQHRKLFDLYNQASECPEGSLDKQALVQDLLAYAKQHFDAEEELMHHIDYPREACHLHKELHRSFVAKLDGLKGQPVYLILDFFQEWLLRHIFVEDRRIGAHTKEAGRA